jgi:hypothetical protein
MRQAGFSHLNLALVSSDKTVRETTKRPHTLEAYVKVVHKACSLGFAIVAYQILGLPNESLESMIQTLAFNARLPVLLGASPFYLTPNAPIARGAELNEEDWVKARLTAMAIETDEFSRGDIYTLFVTTRILNFLKGLAISGAADLDDLLDQRWSESRTQIGFALLQQLVKTGCMHFWTSSGMTENKKFKVNLGARVLTETRQVACQKGGKINVTSFAATLSRISNSQSAEHEQKRERYCSVADKSEELAHS